MTVEFRGGRLGNTGPLLDLTSHLGNPDVQLSDRIDYFSKVVNWGELGNTSWGDCTCASDGHIAIQQTAYGLGRADVVTNADALRAYAAISGFNPGDGPPGSNPTDRGATVLSALEYLRKTGMCGFKIVAHGSLDVKNLPAVKHAVEEFGALSIGIDLPKSAMAQFNAGQPWTVVPGGSPSDGGHCVMVAGFDSAWVYVVTWGMVVPMSWGFWDAYVDEAYAVISELWSSVTGVSLLAFGAEFSAAFGGRNPFAPVVVSEPANYFLLACRDVRSWFHGLFGYKGAHRAWRT